MPAKVWSDGESRILAGSEFQVFGAEIRKAREPNSRLHRGTESRREEEDRRVRTGSLRRSNSAR